VKKRKIEMANKTAIVQVRIEPEVKREVERIFNTLGLSTAEAVNVFFRHVQLERGIPFDVKIPNKQTHKAIEDSRKERNLKKFKKTAELFKELGV